MMLMLGLGHEAKFFGLGLVTAWPWRCKAGLGIKLEGLNFEFYRSLV